MTTINIDTCRVAAIKELRATILRATKIIDADGSLKEVRRELSDGMLRANQAMAKRQVNPASRPN